MKSAMESFVCYETNVIRFVCESSHDLEPKERKTRPLALALSSTSAVMPFSAFTAL